MHIPNIAISALTCSFALLAAATSFGQDADTPAYVIRYELKSTDPDLATAEMDLLTAAYAKLLAAHVESVVGARGQVRQVGLRGATVVLEGCAPQEIAGVARGPTVGSSGLCFVVEEDVVGDVARVALASRLLEKKGQSPAEVDVDDLSWVADSTQYRWVPYSDSVLAERREGSLDFASAPLVPADYELLAYEASGEPPFSPRDFQRVTLAEGPWGGRLVAVTLKEARAEAFARFTGGHIGSRLAIIVDDRLLSLPATVMDRLNGSFVITGGTVGGFTRDEAMETLVRLQLAGGLLEAVVVEQGPSTTLRVK